MSRDQSFQKDMSSMRFDRFEKEESLDDDDELSDEEVSPDNSENDEQNVSQDRQDRRQFEDDLEVESQPFREPDPLDALKKEPVGWQYPRVRNVLPPSALTITHVNQAWDLHKYFGSSDKNDGMEASFNEQQSSDEWLKSHSLQGLKLELKNLIEKGIVDKPVLNKDTGEHKQHIKFDMITINEFEYKLNMAIEMYTKRIKWLLNGSKRMFGLIKGSHVALCVDCSDANLGFGRLEPFQQALLHLVDEQLSQKRSLYLVSFGSEVHPLWVAPRDVNGRTLEEAKLWVSQLRPSGGCNTLRALKHVMPLKQIDSVCLVLGSIPDQSTELICDYVEQLGVGLDMPLHTVSYDCSNESVSTALRAIARASDGRFHCYTSASEDDIYTGTDVSVLLTEIRKTQEVINKIKEMRTGMMGSALISVQEEVSKEVKSLPQSRFLPRPPGHENPLKLEEIKFQVKTTRNWLKQHGLKALKLDLYQVLAPNAYAYREEFIPVIRKTVQSQVHGRAMAQFQWHDGSLRNVHVDMTQLFEYQKQLGATVRLYERRIEWLSSGSRRLFGTVTGHNVVILVDTSAANRDYLIHLQHSLRLLLEQQFSNKQFFNIISFGSTATAWQKTLVPVSPENLQKAWSWILNLECEGSRNFLAAYKLAVENEEELKHGLALDGVYVLTSGVPDQPVDPLCSYVEASAVGQSFSLHTILFNVDDYNHLGAIPGRYANITRTADTLRSLAHCTKGRFHWLRETGIIESDDIKEVALEMEKAINFSRKCAILVEQIKKKYQPPKGSSDDFPQLPEIITEIPFKALPPPKDTSLSKHRRYIAHPEQKPTDDTTSGTKARPQSAKDPMRSVKPHKVKPKKQSFYVEGSKKNSTGDVYKQYPGQKSVRKAIPSPALSQNEDVLTTVEWLRQYSLRSLKLDLTRLVSGPDTKHKEGEIKSLRSKVEAKYCSGIFPLINIGGVQKHLQLLPSELVQYEAATEKVLRRYLRRMQWLLSGSRRVFGTVVHRNCCILIDTSGSMLRHIDELKKELASLVWDQLHTLNASFNLVRFSDTCEAWQPCLVPATEENCHAAVHWASEIVAHGNTATLEAIKLALADPTVEAIYLLSDGKPDVSTAHITRQVALLNEGRHVPINTIAFNTDDSTASDFLQLLARETHGRFHSVHRSMEAHAPIHRLLTEGFVNHEIPRLPDFDGDDLRLLASEISKGRKFLTQAREYRALYPPPQQKSDEKTDRTEKARPKSAAKFVVGRAQPQDNWCYAGFESTRKTETTRS